VKIATGMALTLVLSAVTSLVMSLDCAAEVASPAADLQPFSAHYIADWKGINVAVSDIDMKAGAAPGEYVYRWSVAARGIFRVVYSDPVIQTSWFKIEDGHVHPNKYRGEQGGASVDLTFNWLTKHATGTSEKKPIDLPFKDGVEDLNSIQAEIMVDLRSGDMPKTFQILDKDQLKDFDYVREGTARIRTDLGELDTIVVASQRKGNDRVLRMWFAPSLGFIPVQAERSRHGSVEFAMHIKSVAR
jgi:hypothetical protein